MIDAKELRIGNLLHYYVPLITDKQVVIVEGIYREKDYYWIQSMQYTPINKKGVMPIPLTPEWLACLGFKDYAKNGLSYRLYLNNIDELCWYKQDDSLRYQTRNSGFARNFNIRYVHQLQNLYYALTGKELIYNT